MELRWPGKRKQHKPSLNPIPHCYELWGTDPTLAKANKLILDDSNSILPQLTSINETTIQSIFLDPPFFSNKNYFFKSNSNDRNFLAFTDCWPGNQPQFLQFLNQTIAHCHTLLDSTGAVFLHLDPKVSHFGQLLLDETFSQSNYINQLVWHYKTGSKTPAVGLPAKHDNILLFAKNKSNLKWNTPKQAATHNHNYGFNSMNPVITHRDSLSFHSVPALDDPKLNYPTQKPIKLLQFLIPLTTSPNDLILDPFCGSGTTPAAAAKLNRRFIAIDKQPWAIHTTSQRLLQQQNCFSIWHHNLHPEAKIRLKLTSKGNNQASLSVRDFFPLRTPRPIKGLGRGLSSLDSWALLRRNENTLCNPQTLTGIEFHCRSTNNNGLQLRTAIYPITELLSYTIKTIDQLGRIQYAPVHKLVQP